MAQKNTEQYRFYAELPPHRGSKSASKRWPAFTREHLQSRALSGLCCNIIAVPLEGSRPLYVAGPGSVRMDAFCSVNNLSNSPVEGGVVEREYLRKRCVRIDRELALRLHPNMAAYIGVNRVGEGEARAN